MALQIQKVSNPLTMIAVFASLAEIIATVVLPILESPTQEIFVWFVMGFPAGLVLLFFLTLNFNNRALYAPSDYSDEENFMRALYGGDAAVSVTVEDYGSDADVQAKLRHFWKPTGAVDATNETALKNWLAANGQPDRSITRFIYDAKYKSARQQAVAALNL